MTLEEYFGLPDTPMKDSPSGRLIQSIVNDNPGIDFDIARQQAKQCLLNASKRKRYRIMTPKQEEAQRLRLWKWNENG